MRSVGPRATCRSPWHTDQSWPTCPSRSTSSRSASPPMAPGISWREPGSGPDDRRIRPSALAKSTAPAPALVGGLKRAGRARRQGLRGLDGRGRVEAVGVALLEGFEDVHGDVAHLDLVVLLAGRLGAVVDHDVA